MTESDSQKPVENQRDSETTETNLSPPTRPEGSGRPEDWNEPGPEDVVSAVNYAETIPPGIPTENGSSTTWLEQFVAFKDEAVTELLKVADMGLTTIETEALQWLASRLIVAAMKHDSNSLNEVTRLVDSQLNS